MSCCIGRLAASCRPLWRAAAASAACPAPPRRSISSFSTQQVLPAPRIRHKAAGARQDTSPLVPLLSWFWVGCTSEASDGRSTSVTRASNPRGIWLHQAGDQLLLSGRCQDRITVNGLTEAAASIVSVGNPVVFVTAASLGVCTASLSRPPTEIDADTRLMKVRGLTG